jgi:hypothetical protein
MENDSPAADRLLGVVPVAPIPDLDADLLPLPVPRTPVIGRGVGGDDCSQWRYLSYARIGSAPGLP